MTGIERLRILSEGTKNQALIKVIDYLETRKDMYERYLNEEKTPEQMWQYITKKAKEQSINNCAVIDDRVVYVWAISYFLATNEALSLTTTDTSKSKEEPKKESKKETKKTKTKKSEEQPVEQETPNNVIDIQTAKVSNQITMFEGV